MTAKKDSKPKKVGRPNGMPASAPKKIPVFEGNDVQKTICERFREVRRQSKCTQKEFAAELGLGEPYVKAVEQGRYAPSHEIIYNLCKKYKKSSDWLYGLID